MKRTALRRGLVMAAGGAALAGMVAVGQPAGAATAKSPAPANGISVPPAVSDATSAPSVGSRNAAGIGSQQLDGGCNTLSNGTGDLCLWYYSNLQGSRADFYFADPNLNDNFFVTAGAGQGTRIGNNAESAWNYDQLFTARTWTGMNYTGSSVTLLPNTGRNFVAPFKNNIESFNWI